jgi:tRNA-splicing ligase RtcB
MNKVITTERIPIKLWLDDIDEAALEQAKNLANLPFAVRHIAIMPDSHPGYGMPIGGVFAAQDVVIPNAVGVDIGCGVVAQKTTLTEIEEKDLKDIIHLVKARVPVGFAHNKEQQDELLMPQLNDNTPICSLLYNEALYQLGTLGGGNHFIEIQKGNDHHIWIMIHSGSRNLGKQIADFYNREAKEENKKWFSQVTSKDLAFLPLSVELGKQYLAEMQFCVDFALANRNLMMSKIIGCFDQVLKKDITGGNEMINIAHNYAAMENHFGRNVLVHRKGATSARAGETCIIPGSQGTKTYIVEGLGNPESFMSCSHGAGRRLGRNEAMKSLNLHDEIEIMDRQGIIHGMKSVKDLDEAAGAYKDISRVMENQKDLVRILVELRPIAVIKG